MRCSGRPGRASVSARRASAEGFVVTRSDGSPISSTPSSSSRDTPSSRLTSGAIATASGVLTTVTSSLSGSTKAAAHALTQACDTVGNPISSPITFHGAASSSSSRSVFRTRAPYERNSRTDGIKRSALEIMAPASQEPRVELLGLSHHFVDGEPLDDARPARLSEAAGELAILEDGENRADELPGIARRDQHSCHAV